MPTRCQLGAWQGVLPRCCLHACRPTLTHLQALDRGHAAGGRRVEEQGHQVGHPLCSSSTGGATGGARAGAGGRDQPNKVSMCQPVRQAFPNSNNHSPLPHATTYTLQPHLPTPGTRPPTHLTGAWRCEPPLPAPRGCEGTSQSRAAGGCGGGHGAARRPEARRRLQTHTQDAGSRQQSRAG